MSEEAREAERQRRIKRTREFAERTILRKELIATKEDHALMVISSFLLLKEHIIKKDTTKKILYASIDNLENYLEAMQIIVNEISITQDPMETINKLPIYDEKTGKEIPEEQAKLIHIMNKIRDSIAHDNYVIDENYKNIIIDNPTSGKDGKHFRVVIPIYLLEQLVTLSEESYNKNSIEDFKRNIEDFFKGIKKEDIEQRAVNEDNRYPKEFKIPVGEESQNKDMLEGYQKNDKRIDISRLDAETIIKRVNKELTNLIKEIADNPVLSPMEKERILLFLREENLVDFDFHPILIEEDNIEHATAVRSMITKISSLIPMSTSFENKEKLAALFNYMQTVLSIKIEKNKKNGISSEESRKYRYLKLSKFNPTPKENLKNRIKGLVSTFNSVATDMLTNIESIQNTETKIVVLNRLVEALQRFIENSYEAISNQNVWVLEEMRNATLHANISILGNVVTLKDIPDKTQPNNSKFECTGSIEDLFELTGYIENPNTIPEHITFDEFLTEIKHFGNIGDNQINKLKRIIEMIHQKLTELSMGDLFEQTVSSFGGLK